MGITQCVKRAVQQNPHGPATVFGARTLCWNEFGTRVARLGAGLRSIRALPGDRVAVLALNSDRYLEIYAGVPRAGAVIVPLNTRWSTREIVYAFNDSGATILLVDDAFAPLTNAILAEGRGISAVIHMGIPLRWLT
jgi:acyl-CoA synthetase (AMP-forming)/AMP-acid ligase II